VGKSKKHLRISTQKIIFNLHNSGVESNKKVSRPKKMKNSLKLTLWEMEKGYVVLRYPGKKLRLYEVFSI